MVRHLGQPFQATLGQCRHTHLQREVDDDGHEIAVTDSLAVAVDRALHLGRTRAHRGQRVGDAAAGVIVQVDADGSAAEVVVDLRDDALDVERQRTAIGVAEHETVDAGHDRTFEHAQRELGIVAVPVEEMLGVEEHAQPGALQERHRLRHHCDTLVERGAQRFGDVVVPCLPHDAHGRRARFDQVAQSRIVVDLALHASGRAEGDKGRCGQVQIGARAAEELFVFRVRAGEAALDVVHTEVVELLRDMELVLDRERNTLELAAVAQGRVEDLDGGGRAVPTARVCRPCSVHDCPSLPGGEASAVRRARTSARTAAVRRARLCRTSLRWPWSGGPGTEQPGHRPS